MSTQDHNIPDNGPTLPIGALLRMCADGEELTPEQLARVEEHCQQNQDKPCCMKFEQALRARVASTMEPSDQIPSELRASIESMLSGPSAQPAPDTVIRVPASFWSARRLAPLAAAAAVLLFLGATLVWQSTSLFGPSMPTWIESTQQASLVSFLDGEHARVSTSDEMASRKFSAQTPAQTVSLIEDQLGNTPCQLNLVESCDMELVGAGDCQVPGQGPSVHAMYRNTTTNEMLSVFIQKDPASTQADPSCLCASRISEGNEVLAWRYNGLIYYVVCPNPQRASEVMAAFGAPESRKHL